MAANEAENLPPEGGPPDADVDDENDLDGFIEEIEDDGFIEDTEDDVKVNLFQAVKSSNQALNVTPENTINNTILIADPPKDKTLNEVGEKDEVDDDDDDDDKGHRAELDGNVIIIKEEPSDDFVFPLGEETRTVFDPTRREILQIDYRSKHEPLGEGVLQEQTGTVSVSLDMSLPPGTTKGKGSIQGLEFDLTRQQSEQPFHPVIESKTTPKEKKPRKRTPPGEKPYQCTICDKAFSQTCSLLIHKRRHTGEKPYECSVCGRRFYSRSNQTVHERTHTGERPYSCSYCDKRFIQWSQMSQHMVIHTGEKMYKCKVCNKAFTQSGILNRHMYTHSGVKNFRCSVCEKGFAHESNLTRHMRIHTGEKPFQCKLCPNSYAHNSSFNVHMKVHARKEAEAKARAAAEIAVANT